jgi:hypothetical protein
MPEVMYQGAKDVILNGVRAAFDVAENQGFKVTRALQNSALLGADPLADTLFTTAPAADGEGEKAVWRYVEFTAARNQGTRSAGGQFPDADFLRGYETAVLDPDNQLANKFQVPFERQNKEMKSFKPIVDRGRLLIDLIEKSNIKDPLEVFNLAFTAPSSYPTTGVGGNRFFARGNKGLDGNYSALGERLVSTQHARADGGATWTNAVTESGNASALTTDSFWAAKLLGFTGIFDDVGNPYPAFGGQIFLVTAPANMKVAKQLDASEWEINVADNQINIHKGMQQKTISSTYLTQSAYNTGVANPNQWFIVDSDMRSPEIGLGFIVIPFVPLQSNVYKDDGLNSAVYNIMQEKVYGAVNPRAVVGSNGTGAAYTS